MTDMTQNDDASVQYTAPHYSAAGAARAEAFALPGKVFDGVVNEDVLHQAVKVYLANQRQGTHKVKTRREVSGGGRKPWKQKGTGRARQGSNRAPHWRGGGVAFGPSPRDYRTDIPKKVRQLARRSALNARVREGMLKVIDPINMTEPKTQALLALLGKLAPEGTKILVLTAEIKPALYLSARNVKHLNVLPYSDAAAYDILHAQLVVIESTAIGAEVSDEVAEAPAKKSRAKKAAPAGDGESPAPKKARAKKVSE